MRIAFLHPTYWPEVRRGSERLIHDLGVELTARGHEVTLLTSHRARPARAREDGIDVRRAWRPGPIPGLAAHEYHVATLPAQVTRVATGSYDVAHAFFPGDAWAAVKARTVGGPPVVMTLHGIPTREYLVARRYRLQMIEAAVAGAAECSVLSEAARARFRRYLLRDPRILPGGVVTEAFEYAGERSESPTLFCPASLGDPRKRGPLLIRAFSALRERVPEAQLVVAAGADPVMSAQPLDAADGVKVIGLGDDADLARAYSSAWVTVLPSVDEAFGLVLLESLAAGTPVVAARSGACPEIVTEPGHGRLFEPDDADDLTRALEDALRLATSGSGEAERRARAAEFGWGRVAGLYEAVYEEVA